MSNDNSEYKKSLLQQKSNGSNDGKMKPLADKAPDAALPKQQPGKKKKR